MKQITTKLKGVMFLAFTLVLSLSCGAQTLNSIQNSFNNYKQYALQEKVYAHTDKGSYMTGEIMWFKIYAVDGTNNKPLNLSKVAYVELLDNNQVAVLQTKVELRNGSGSGSIYIPVTTNNGNYKLRAYTNWMKNFSPDYYFEKNITLVNPQIAPNSMAVINPADFDIQFFPEGGDLVNGISSKVAFKAADKNGKGITFSGAIIDQKNDTIVRFKPLMFGMGNFSFTPDAANTYKAVIKVGNNAAVTKPIPAIDQQGYVMQLADNGSGQLQVTVTTNTKLDEPDLYLFVHSKQVVKVAKRVVPINGSASFTIDKSTLEDGISHITIFNNNKKPVCERLYFKRPTKLMAINASTDKTEYGERKKVNISLATKDNTGKAANANLSMSVYRLDAFQTLEPGDIASYLWLSSDLKGSIESAEYYLKNNTAEVDAAADNLMLTQGWRRFQWSDVLKNKPAAFTFLPEYNGHIVTGKLINTLTNTPTADVVAYFGIPGKKVQLFTARSDSSGKLLFNTKGFYGPGEIVIQTNTQHDSTYRIDIVSPFSEQYSKSQVPQFNLTPDMQQSLEKNSLGMQVLNIYSGENIRHYDLPRDSSAFFGTPDKVYKLDDYTRFTTMEEVLREYIREVYVVRSDKRYHIKVISGAGFLEGDPLVMLDGIPIFDIDKVIAIDPLKVKRLDVIKDRYFWGSADAEGILSYTTYKGDLGGVELDPHAVVLDYEGLQLQRVFYSPAYDSDKAAASRVPDFRNVLYWAPTVNTGAQGAKQLSFYTSDQEGQYIGVIQGLTADGQAGSQYFKFDVKK
ncbi:MAG: hypothetical protein ACHQHN_06385 [Sphingobacteriales bacterium]